MLNWLIAHKWRAALTCAALGAILSLAAATLSKSYNDCGTDREQYYTDYANPDFFEQAGTFVVCEGVTIDSNGELLTAVGTLAVAVFTLTLWLATIEQGRLTAASIKQAKESSERELRAYLALRKVRIKDVTIGKRPTVTMQIVNVGATPAYGFTQQVSIGFLLHEQLGPALALITRQWPGSRATLAPGQAAESETTSDDVMDGAILQALEEDRGAIYVVVRSNYTDVFLTPPRFKNAVLAHTATQLMGSKKNRLEPLAFGSDEN